MIFPLSILKGFFLCIHREIVEYNRKRFQIKRRGTAERAFAKTGSPKTHPVLYRVSSDSIVVYQPSFRKKVSEKIPADVKHCGKTTKIVSFFVFSKYCESTLSSYKIKNIKKYFMRWRGVSNGSDNKRLFPILI
ncbi:hypothetical protein M769_0102595 [Bacillus haynesii]|nr:hypothetical protein M769_0102595 [Bacillus haynesii]